MPATIIHGEQERHKETVPENSIAIDTTHQIITGVKISQHPVHDIPHAGKILKLFHRTRKSDLYVIDKGYDSESIHELIRDTLHSYSIIPVRTKNGNISQVITRRGLLNRLT